MSSKNFAKYVTVSHSDPDAPKALEFLKTQRATVCGTLIGGENKFYPCANYHQSVSKYIEHLGGNTSAIFGETQIGDVFTVYLIKCVVNYRSTAYKFHSIHFPKQTFAINITNADVLTIAICIAPEKGQTVPNDSTCEKFAKLGIEIRNVTEEDNADDTIGRLLSQVRGVVMLIDVALGRNEILRSMTADKSVNFLVDMIFGDGKSSTYFRKFIFRNISATEDTLSESQPEENVIE